jgi:hypothetical protein
VIVTHAGYFVNRLRGREELRLFIIVLLYQIDLFEQDPITLINIDGLIASHIYISPTVEGVKSLLDSSF